MPTMAPIKERAIKDVLSFFANPNRKYMGHFFFFKDDVPVLETRTVHHRKGGGDSEKMAFSTKKGRLFLSDVDAIIRRYHEFKGAKTYEEIAIGVLPVALLDLFDQNNLSINKVIPWAKKEASALLEQEPKKVVSMGAPKMDPGVKFLLKTLASMAPNLPAEDLKHLLVDYVQDEAKLNQATQILDQKAKKIGRNGEGFIRLRGR